MNTVKSIVMGVFCIAAGAVAVADELPLVMYVTNGNANGKYPYATRETAAPDLKTALDVAVDGQEIVLLKSKDAYKTTEQLLINKAIVVHGETGNPEDVVIDAQQKGRNVMINHAQALLHSVVLANGELGVWPKEAGNGNNLLISNDGGTASNCVIRGGYVVGYWASAAAHLKSQYALLTHSVVTNNFTDSPGTEKTAGVQLENGAKASNCLIADNHELATDGTCCAGGAYVQNGTLENCTIVRNSAHKWGGVRIVRNTWDPAFRPYEPTVKNCVIVGNVSDKEGASYNNVDPDQKAMFDHCACDDEEKLNGTCVRDTPANLFAGYANGDYTVAPGSVLIDKGAEVSDPPALDLANFTRVMNGTIDIGAYEYDTSTFSLGLKTDVSKAIVPVTVTFEVSGVSEDDVCEYAWDFDGDGTVDLTTSTNKVQHTFAQGGRYSPILTVEDKTAGKSATQDFPNLLYLMPKTIYVVSNSPGAAFPYGSFATAATTLSEALSAAIDGMEIVLSNGTHNVTTQILVDKPLDIHGYEADPARTVVKYPSGDNSEQPGFRNTRAGTFIHDLTFDGTAVNRPGWNLEGYGVISNCIIRGMKNYGYWGSVGAVSADGKNTLVTHCVITNNETTTGGAPSKAIVKATGGARIENCLIARNKDTVGTPLARGSAGAFVNCTVVSNELSTSTVLTDEGALGVTNCIFAANVRTGSGSDFSFKTDVPTACNRNLADTEVAGWLCEPDAAKIFTDPAAQNWHLSVNSPARDCGVRHMNLPATDLDGNPRKVGRVDLGCYENPVGNGMTLLVR